MADINVESLGSRPDVKPEALGTPRSKVSWSERAIGVASQIILITWGVIVVLPLLWMVMTSFKTDKEIFFSPWELPHRLQWSNFSRAWEEASIGTYFLNSVVVTGGSLVLSLLVGSMLAYALGRYEFRFRRAIQFMFLIGLMFPVFLALVPLFFVARDLHLLNTLHGLVIIYTAYSLPFTVFFLTGFFRSLPTELGEAAILDGASHYRVFFEIMLPLARPGLAAAGIFVFLSHWNQFVLPFVLNANPDKYVLSQGLAFLAIQQGYAADWSALFAGLTISMVPTLIVYAFFQSKIQQGMTAGAMSAR
ncbi:MAG: carbohydrate ABC transporter permease [Thermomicrobiales bacterium]